MFTCLLLTEKLAVFERCGRRNKHPEQGSVILLQNGQHSKEREIIPSFLTFKLPIGRIVGNLPFVFFPTRLLRGSL